MVRSELVQKITDAHPQLSPQTVEAALEAMLNAVTESLAQGRRVEIRGFGIFMSRDRTARMGRNPKTGEAVPVAAKQVPRFKASNLLLERLNDNR